jgi:uncharacterized protein
MEIFSNRLANEKSPYLLQHAHNPVDWYAWGDEAFEKSRREDKPIFLSIGYSTCHWCHVMERESFEDEGVARLLNSYFVCIKVDREERPDVDAVYMSALQAMTGSGGWPMSVFLTPELKPFFAGTYFPPIPAHGRPSFGQLIERIQELWITERDTLVESSEHITESLQNPQGMTGSTGTRELRDMLDNTYRYFENSFDRAEGGFGGAPKFPRPVQFDCLFNYFAARHNDRARDMALHTLRKMTLGGINDHLGGGFHRYSVDRYWLVSHFEKMLYDQAQLVNSYLDAWQISHDSIFRNTVVDIIEYILRDMTHELGGFFSAEDADSEGVEGKFYVWTIKEINDILGDDAPQFIQYYGITQEGNFEHGNNVLHIANQTLSSLESLESFAAPIKKLFASREKRIRPLLDDKILTSWNGLMIGAMARAGDVLGKKQYIESAKKAANFIWDNLRNEGKLLHRWRDGEARYDAYLDDYAFLIKGLLDLYEASFEKIWIERAIELQQKQDAMLYDTRSGIYNMNRPSSDIIFQSKNDYDGAEPSGNSISALNLFRLAMITEKDSYEKRAEEILQYFSAKISEFPYSMPEMMTAAFWSMKSPMQIVFAGSDVLELKQSANDKYLPVCVKMLASESVGEFAKSLTAIDGKPAAYVCRNFTCELPVTDGSKLERLLSNSTD